MFWSEVFPLIWMVPVPPGAGTVKFSLLLLISPPQKRLNEEFPQVTFSSVSVCPFATMALRTFDEKERLIFWKVTSASKTMPPTQTMRVPPVIVTFLSITHGLSSDGAEPVAPGAFTTALPVIWIVSPSSTVFSAKSLDMSSPPETLWIFPAPANPVWGNEAAAIQTANKRENRRNGFFME
ncbi:MAG: hypothetical protein HFF78_01635 [Oscillospiraceae bacterium]|nr:hypothetical protein [Oscillospiraceae bacterium]